MDVPGRLLPIFLLTTSIAWTPVQARSLWLRCGDDQINLDMRQNQYQARVGINLYSGQTQSDPQKVVLTTNWIGSSINDRMTYQLIVDRSNLRYTRTLMVRLPADGGGNRWEVTDQQNGQCNLMAINYKGNRI